MAKSQKITQYRERLDRTLASPKLTNQESLKSLVRKQILQSSGKDTEGCGEKVIEKRTAEVANFLDMLRSVSENSDDRSKAHETEPQPEWKVKQDNEEFRVMYREGPQGSPFHSLLVEGYVDGPLDICLCISWESGLYNKWWPQSTIPTFKILSCKNLLKIRDGEQISSVRVKVSWPLSTREAIMHYFLFEYFEDDLVVVLLNTVSDSGSSDGFPSEAIPEAKDVVRIGLVGGFALQKVTPERSYFRTITTMDIKLDFVPPALINFVSRQLVGNGFRLYQKAIASRFTTDEDFSNALKGSLYARIREALYSTNKSNGYVEEKEPETEKSNIIEANEATKNLAIAVPEEEDEATNDLVITFHEERKTPDNLDSSRVTDQKVDSGFHEVKSPLEDTQVVGPTTYCEIEELKSEDSKRFDDQVLIEKITERPPVSGKRSRSMSSEVEQALGTLEKVISMVRQYGLNSQIRSAYGFTNERTPKKSDADMDSRSLQCGGVDSDLEAHIHVERESTARKSSQESIRNSPSICSSRQGGSNSFSKEVYHNRIAPASPEQKLSIPSDTDTNQVGFCSGPADMPILNHSTESNKYLTEANGVHETGRDGGNKLGKERKNRFCCFGMIA